MADEPDSGLALVDATDALLVVIVRPSEEPDAINVKSHANGMPKAVAAWLLRELADSWEREAEDERS